MTEAACLEGQAQQRFKTCGSKLLNFVSALKAPEKMTTHEDSESRLFLPSSIKCLDPTKSRSHSQSLPSLIASSATQPVIRPSGSLFLPQTPGDNQLIESPTNKPTVFISSSFGGQRKRNPPFLQQYLTKNTLLLVMLGVGGGFLIWLTMRLTSNNTNKLTSPLYFSTLDPEDRELCGKPDWRRRSKRVVGGKEAEYAEWPWTVSESKHIRHLLNVGFVKGVFGEQPEHQMVSTFLWWSSYQQKSRPHSCSLCGGDEIPFHLT